MITLLLSYQTQGKVSITSKLTSQSHQTLEVVRISQPEDTQTRVGIVDLDDETHDKTVLDS